MARIAGMVGRLAHVREWSPEIAARAVDELQELAGTRAEVAGVVLGAGERRPDAEWVRREAALCVAAGADVSQIEMWAHVGRERIRMAARRPYTGSGQPGLGGSSRTAR